MKCQNSVKNAHFNFPEPEVTSEHKDSFINRQTATGQIGRTQICHRHGNVKYLMARHDQDFHDSNPATLQTFGIDLIPPPEKKGDRQRKLNQQETFWIDKLQATKHPGLNEDQDFTAFL